MKPFTQAVAQGPIDLQTPQFWEAPARVTMGDEMAQPDPDQFLVNRNIALGRRRFQASAFGRLDPYKPDAAMLVEIRGIPLADLLAPPSREYGGQRAPEQSIGHHEPPGLGPA